jgi:hypothetical protein
LKKFVFVVAGRSKCKSIKIKKSRVAGLYSFKRVRSYEELLLAPFLLADAFEALLEPPFEAPFFAVALEALLELPFEEALEPPLEELFEADFDPLFAPPFDADLAAPLDELLPAAFFAVAMFFEFNG